MFSDSKILSAAYGRPPPTHQHHGYISLLGQDTDRFVLICTVLIIFPSFLQGFIYMHWKSPLLVCISGSSDKCSHTTAATITIWSSSITPQKCPVLYILPLFLAQPQATPGLSLFLQLLPISGIIQYVVWIF